MAGRHIFSAKWQYSPQGQPIVLWQASLLPTAGGGRQMKSILSTSISSSPLKPFQQNLITLKWGLFMPLILSITMINQIEN